MTVVHFDTGEVKDYESVSVKVSGFVVCCDYGKDTRDVFPPHRIDKLHDSNVSEKDRAERITYESAHGRV
jgi:hypothetical protein